MEEVNWIIPVRQHQLFTNMCAHKHKTNAAFWTKLQNCKTRGVKLLKTEQVLNVKVPNFHLKHTFEKKYVYIYFFHQSLVLSLDEKRCLPIISSVSYMVLLSNFRSYRTPSQAIHLPQFLSCAVGEEKVYQLVKGYQHSTVSFTVSDLQVETTNLWCFGLKSVFVQWRNRGEKAK